MRDFALLAKSLIVAFAAIVKCTSRRTFVKNVVRRLNLVTWAPRGPHYESLKVESFPSS